MPIDVARARAETPACSRLIHFNNAGAALMPQTVVDAQIRHLRLEAENGGYEAAARAAEQIQATYDAVARLLNCGSDEVALVENATVGWALAFGAFRFQPSDRILTAEAEYAANYIAYLKAAKDRGLVIDVVPSDETGQLSVSALEKMIDDKVKLISITHVPTNGGLINPAAEIGQIAKAAGIPYLLDACQSAGQLPLDVEEIGCDLLSVTGRKYLRGPRGSGFLYVRKSLLHELEPPLLDLHAAAWVERDRYELRPDARRFENWEFNYAAVIGLGVAVNYALDWGLDDIADRVGKLAQHLRLRLEEELGLPVYDLGKKRCGIVTTSIPGESAEKVRERLVAQGINVSHSTPSSTRIDAEKRHLPDLLRLSVHYYNTEKEVDAVIQALAEIKKG